MVYVKAPDDIQTSLWARIKKIMQADEEVGKIALATPVLISKALELFLQDLCDQTYDITLKRGAKTVSALHLKQCVQKNAVFDFLHEIVAKVPDIGSDGHGEEKASSRKRKQSDENENEDDTEDDDSKRTKQESSSSIPCRGRGRGRGRGRRSRNDAVTRNGYVTEKSDLEKSEDVETDTSDTSVHVQARGHPKTTDIESAAPPGNVGNQAVRDFDLNMDPDESVDIAAPANDTNHNDTTTEWNGSLGKVFNVDTLHLQLNQNKRFTQDEDDYDCEDDEDG